MSDAANPTVTVPVPAPVIVTAPRTFSLGDLIGAVSIALVLSVSLSMNLHFLHSPSVPPSPVVPAEPVDAHFVAVGKTLAPSLAPGYAVAWLAGDQALASGKPFSAAVAAVGSKWEDTRKSAFSAAIQAELAKIVPDGTPDAQVTAQQVAAVRAAFRGLAEGLNGGKLPAVQFIPLRFSPPTKSEPRALFVSRSSEVKAAIASDSLKPKPSPVPAPAPTVPEVDRWSWQVIVADPRLEGWGHLEGGTWIYYQTRWRS